MPLAAIAIVGGLRLLGKQPRSVNARGNDVPGSVTVVAGLVALVYGLANAETGGWSSVTTLVCIAVGVVLAGRWAPSGPKVTTVSGA